MSTYKDYLGMNLRDLDYNELRKVVQSLAGVTRKRIKRIEAKGKKTPEILDMSYGYRAFKQRAYGKGTPAFNSLATGTHITINRITPNKINLRKLSFQTIEDHTKDLIKVGELLQMFLNSGDSVKKFNDDYRKTIEQVSKSLGGLGINTKKSPSDLKKIITPEVYKMFWDYMEFAMERYGNTLLASDQVFELAYLTFKYTTVNERTSDTDRTLVSDAIVGAMSDMSGFAVGGHTLGVMIENELREFRRTDLFNSDVKNSKAYQSAIRGQFNRSKRAYSNAIDDALDTTGDISNIQSVKSPLAPKDAVLDNMYKKQKRLEASIKKAPELIEKGKKTQAYLDKLNQKLVDLNENIERQEKSKIKREQNKGKRRY